MSVEQTDVVDFASIDKDGNAVLTIADQLEWDQDNKHLLLLQEKVNCYLNAIESGELYKKYPLSEGKKIVIIVVLKYSPSEEGERFLRMVQKRLSEIGYDFRHKTLNEKTSEDQLGK